MNLTVYNIFDNREPGKGTKDAVNLIQQYYRTFFTKLVNSINQSKGGDFMKLYGIEPIFEAMPWGEKVKVISLGEKGRGRRLSYVLFDAEYDPSADNYEASLDDTGLARIFRTERASNGWIMKLSGAGTYTRDTHGTVYVLNEYVGNVKVLAYGFGAWGTAGRIGDWWEFVVTVKEPAVFLIRPAGGSGKRPRWFLVVDGGKTVRVDQEEVALWELSAELQIGNPNEMIKEKQMITPLNRLIQTTGGSF